MTLERDGKPSMNESMERDAQSPYAQNLDTEPVTTRVGKNPVEIDVKALKHLVDTVKAKLEP
jgi:hypothetical protein